MGTLIKMQRSSGDVILVEGDSNQRVSRSNIIEKIIEKLDVKFCKIMENEIYENCKMIEASFKKLEDLDNKPSKASAEFGLQFSTEGNIYVTKVTGNCNFKITMEWSL